MTGEIEEPFRMNLQADLLHSGSISFGRFESESLSWERRSIFSHNRYLEEVEKYSKPGSVTEKKAYFEAEFRRKALLKQRSSESQDGGEFPTSQNNDLHDLEVTGNDNESPCIFNPSECDGEIKSQYPEKGDVEALYENDNANTNIACFDERSHNSGYDDDSISPKCERQDFEFLPVATQDEPANYTTDCPVSVLAHFELDGSQQSETESLVGISEQSTEVIIVDKVMLVDVTSEANDSSHTCQTPEKDHDRTCSASQTTFSPKVKPVLEKKHTRATSKTQANVDRFQKQLSNESSKGLVKPKASESKGLLGKKPEKKSIRPASPFTGSRVKPLKPEDATRNKEKEVRLKNSIVKDPRSEKAVRAPLLPSEKSLPAVRATVNRSKQTATLSNTQSAAGFSFRTDQRAGNRKESYTKITEKMHVKEAEINQVEAKTPEKQAADMKQFCRSLNFKTKPMPSLYNESARASGQHKVTSMSKTLNLPRPSSQSMATRRDKNPFMSSVSSNIKRPSSSSSTNRNRLSESVRINHVFESACGSDQHKVTPMSKTPNQPRPSSQSKATPRDKNPFMSCVPSNVRRPNSSTSSTNRIRPLESIRRNHVPEKNADMKKKDANSKKQKETTKTWR